MKKSLIALAAVAATSVALAAEPAAPLSPAALHYTAAVAVANAAATTETNRLLAITAIANGTTDPRVKDRALAELERGAAPAPVMSQYVEPPNPWLQALGIIAQPLAFLGNAAIQANTTVKLDAGATARHNTTMGTIGGIAQGAYGIASQSMGAQASAFEAGAAAFAGGAAAAAPAEPSPAPATEVPQ